MTESLRSLLARPRVLIAGVAMVVVAVTAMTLIPSLTSSAGSKLLADLNALGSDAWLVEPQPQPGGLPGRVPEGALNRAADLPGVSVALRELSTDVSVQLSTQESRDRGVRVIGLDEAPALSSLTAEVGAYRPVPGLPFALVGARAADLLGLTQFPATVFARGYSFVVTGTLSGDPLLPELDEALITDVATALRLSGVSGIDRVVLRTSAPLDAAKIRGSIDPFDIAALAVGRPRALVEAKQQSTATLDGLAVYASIAAFGIAGLGITIMLAAAVRQRTAELAIRRVHGAPKRSIFALIASEGLALGVIGGVLGTVVSVTSIHVVTSVNDWPNEARYSLLATAFAAATIMCQLAAALPAWLAVRIEPAAAFAVE